MNLNNLILATANNAKVALLVYGTTLGLGSVLFSVLEGRTLWDSLHWAVTTALTIRYGDVYPTTVVGRAVYFVLAHIWALFLVPCIVANIIVRILRNENEFTHHEQEQLKLDIQEILAAIKNGK